MGARRLDNIAWYVDQSALDRDEPGLRHSFVASLATALDYIDPGLDPTWLMGSSAFAFRIFVNEVFCPSAMSIFDWSAILPASVEQAGFCCRYISRLWHEDDVEEARRSDAHSAIVQAIDRGVPAVVWDVADAEWGLIVGYDDARSYATLTCRGESSFLPFARLGRNGIDILSVAIPGERNGRQRQEVVRGSLRAAVGHAEQREWMDRPSYQDGPAAFDLWALLHQRWALIVERGRPERLPDDLPRFARFYAGHHYAARCYARDYLRAVADGDDHLIEAAAVFSDVAASLRPVWECGYRTLELGVEILDSLAEAIRDAGLAERRGIELIRLHLAEPSS